MEAGGLRAACWAWGGFGEGGEGEALILARVLGGRKTAALKRQAPSALPFGLGGVVEGQEPGPAR